MSGTLYRKYRSKSFADVIGQEHITTTIQNSIKNGSFAHAYLLTGPRGVGKTSVARLFAYAVNGLDYKKDDGTYSDIIEIDAASNRRIDEIRELREKVNIAPSALKYKVYIIDEVHMLTKEAFNALLKTLEEPPQHAIFILATTDFHKVPDTIISRCVRFAFSSISPESIKKHLANIAKKESIDIEAEALDIIADNADGSFRDAISLLDQFKNSAKKIKADYVAKTLGLSPETEIAGLIKNLEASQPKKIIEALDKLTGSGAGAPMISRQLMAYLRSCLLGEKNTTLERRTIISLIENLLKLDNYSDTRLALEIILLEACRDETPGQPADTKPVSRPQPAQKPAPDDTDSVDNEPEPDPIEPADNISDDVWENALNSLKSTNNTLYAIARMAETKRNGGNLELRFKFPFHYKQMKLERNYMQLEKTLKTLDGTITTVNLIIKDKDSSAKASGNESVESISNIFGPSEVLES